MKTSNIILAVLIGGLALSMMVDIATSKKEGSEIIEGVALTGKRVSRTYETLALKHLNIEGPIKVILSAGIPQLSIEADEGLLDQLSDKDDDPETLSIELPQNTYNAGEITAYLSTPTLETISLTNGSIESPDALPYLNNTITLSGSASASMKYGSADLVQIKGSGGTKARLTGTTKKLVAGLSGGNEIIAGQLIAQVVEIMGSGSTTARVHADSILNISASGSSTLQYTGSPKVSFSSSGSARLEAI
jgi:hypothetical protein